MNLIRRINITTFRKIAPFLALVLLSFTVSAQNGTDLFFSEYLEGTGNNQALEIFNPGDLAVDLSAYCLVRSNDGGGWEIWRNFPAGKFLPPKTVWTIVNDQFTATPYDIKLANEKDLSPFIAFRGNDAIGLLKISAVDTVPVDIIGVPGINPGSGWDVAGILDGTANHTLIRKSGIVSGNTDWDASRGINEINSEWIVKDIDFADSLGHHFFKPVIPVISIKLSLTASSIIVTDKGSLHVTADILPVTASNKVLFWSSSDPLVASVDQDGNVKAFNNGSTWIMAVSSDGTGISDSIEITAQNQTSIYPISQIMVSGSGGVDTIRENQGKLLMTADIIPANATNKIINWTVDDTIVANISAGGILTARRNGKVVVTATSTDGSGISGSKTIIILGQFSEMSSLSALRADYTAGETIYKITGEVVLTQFIYYRNIKYIQDASAGIQIDDETGVISGVYKIGDGITGLTGYLQEINGMLLFHPIEDPGAPSSVNNIVKPVLLTVKEFNENFDPYESRLVKINGLKFDQAGTKFLEFFNYTVSAGNDMTIVRTEFAGSDFLGTDVPDSANVTGIAIRLNTSPKIAPRKTADFEILPLPPNGIQSSVTIRLSIYPNPVTSELHVAAVNENIFFEIKDISGRIIMSHQPLSQERIIDTGNLNQGLYFISFYSTHDRIELRFIKK